ncbi:MAG: transcription antitermination factor NusB [Desulfovibrionales bacterium]
MPKRPRTELPPARRAALDCLGLTLDQGLDLQDGLDRVLTSSRLSPQDSRLATELSYGYLRQKGRLEYLLSRYLKDPGKVPGPVQRILGLAAYELLFGDRIPAYASVNWAVEGIKAGFGTGLSRMANAVLRRVGEVAPARNDEDLYRRDKPELTRFLSRYYSAPEWIITLWLEAYGLEQTVLLLKASLSIPPLGLRFNRQKTEALSRLRTLEDDDDCIASAGYGVALKHPPRDLDTLVRHGLASRQSLSVQETLLACDPGSWPDPVWDACSGRGGKSLFLAETGKSVWASDSNLKRLQGLHLESVRLGMPLPAFAAKADTTAPLQRNPGTVLLDVPCSGLGVLSRRPDIKWKRRPKDLDTLTALQSRMLLAALHVLPRGGTLVYMTCTMNPRENEQQIHTLLAGASNVSLEREYQTSFDSLLREFFYAAVLSVH